MPQRTIRFSETTLQQIQQAAKQKGFASSGIGLGVNKGETFELRAPKEFSRPDS